MARHVLMLEDSAERLHRFAAALMSITPAVTFLHWNSAHTMIRECPAFLHTAALICLDHDLDPVSGEDDPGDGLLVARFLAPLRPSCPILIHTSNADGARRMLGEFELEHCAAHTILPLGEAWIERYWRAKVERFLVRP